MFITGCILLLLSTPIFGAIPKVKVLVGRSLDKVVIQGTDLKKVYAQTKQAHQFTGKKTIQFTCSTRATNTKFKDPILVAELSSPTGLVSWENHKYQGDLKLIADPSKTKCNLVNEVSLESYITTLLAKEMNGSWPVEALKAQAVAARTYAYERLKNKVAGKLYDLESSEKDQVSGTFFDITDKTLLASKETQGEILMGPRGKISPAFFHSKCGGKTLRPDQVWGGVEEGYKSVDCPYCMNKGRKDWTTKVKNEKILSLVDTVLKRYYSDEIKDKELRILPDSQLNSEVRLYAGDRLHIIKKSYLRNFAGRDLIPSNNFKLSMKGNDIHVHGQGYGHGVGLCQLGALELAQRGYNYRQILSHYFPNHKVVTAYKK